MSFFITKHSDLYNKSVTHPLTTELCKGTLPNHVLFTYLNQDLKFFNLGLSVMGKALAVCPNPESRVRLARQIGFFANDENLYFTKTLEELEHEDLSQVAKLKSNGLVLPEVQEYLDFMKRAIYNYDYVQIATFLYVMEKIYLDWATSELAKEKSKSNLPYKYQEWINLHTGKAFTEWVEFLEKEVVDNTKSTDDKRKSEDTFVETVKLEIGFFESCYSYRD